MSINSRNKGAAFERQIANALIEDLNLTNPVKRILEQTRTKELPDLMLGNWCIECKAYGTGAEPRPDWWDQVLASSQGTNLKPALEHTNAELTLRAETSVSLDQEMSEKVLKIMDFMDELDDVQEVHTNAEFPENFEVKE